MEGPRSASDSTIEPEEGSSMRVPRIELTLTASMLLMGAPAAIAQPTHHEEMAALAAAEIAQATSTPGTDGMSGEEIAKARKIEGGMTWAEVTIVRALLADCVDRDFDKPTTCSNGTRSLFGG